MFSCLEPRPGPAAEVGGRRAFFLRCILGECNGGCILYKVIAVVGNIIFYEENE